MLGVIPSFATGFAQWPGISEYPQLWKGLVGAWCPFMGATGNKVFDMSGNGNIGTLMGNVIFGPGRFGSGLNMPGGAGDYVLLDNLNFFRSTSQFSLFAWVKFNDTSARRAIMGKTGGDADTRFVWEINADDKHAIYVYGLTNPGYHYGNTLTPGLFYHLVVTWNGSTLKIFENGLQVFSTDTGGTAPLLNRIGRYDGQYEFSGLNEYSGAYNYALSASEIALLYQMMRRLAT